MIEAGDGEHPDEVEKHRRGDRHGADSHPKHREAAEVQENEWQGSLPIHLLR